METQALVFLHFTLLPYTLVFIVFAGVLLFLLLAMTLRALLSPERALSPAYSAYSQQQWRKQLSRWGIVLENAKADSVLQDIESSWTLISPLPTQLLIIILVLLSTFASAVVSQLSTLYLLLAMLYIIMLGSRLLSYFIGAARLRWQTRSLPKYADLHPRLLSTYRFIWFRGLTTILLLSSMLTTIWALPFLSSSLTFCLPGTTAIPLSIGPWVLWGILGAMLLIGIAAEVFVERIAATSRLLVTTDPLLARSLDDLFRARVIGQIQGDMCICLAFLFVVQWGVIWASLSAQAPSALHVSLGAETLLVLLTYVVGLISYLFQGRLGGTITGWPWQRSKLV